LPHASTARALALAAALAGLAGSAAAQLPRQDPKACVGQPELPMEPLQIRTDRGVQSFKVEVADTAEEREYGLMCRKALAADRGMLFLFRRAGALSFWMRNTLIPLDIIYIGEDGRVVSISRNAQPLDERPLPSSGPAKFVLEVAAGRAAQIGLLPGDRVLHRALPHG
jgi:uncharacterized membrane protein (UPF0127 family)